MIDLIYKEKTHQLRGLIYDVHNRLGIGWDEETYHQATIEAFKGAGVPVDSKVRQIIKHRRVEVDRFECDLIAWDLIILELKVLPYTTFAPIHFAQLGHYLKVWNKRLGLLVDFGGTKTNIERVVWSQPELIFKEDYSALERLLMDEHQKTLECIREIALSLGGQYGLGYPESFWRNLFKVETHFQGVECQNEFKIPLAWNTKKLPEFTSDHFLINGNCLLNIRALLDHPTQYDFLRMKTYLRALGLPIGLIVNFGKKHLQIHAVNAS